MFVSRALLVELALSAGLVAGACNDPKMVDACGDALPMEGALCTREGQECLPDETGCGLYTGVRCSGGVWVFFEAGTGQCTAGGTDEGDTEAPTVPCGDELPPEGTRCEQDGADCAPDADACAGHAGATCTEGRWKRYEAPPGDPEDCQNTLDCAQLCPAIVAAQCPSGPADESACVSDCEAWSAGPCSAEFSAAVTCAGQPPSFHCDAADRPTVAGCDGQFEALHGCLG